MDTINVRIKYIDLIEKSLKRIAIVQNDTQFSYEVKSQSAYNDDRKTIVIGVEVTVNIIGIEEEVARILTATEFDIENYEDAFMVDKDGKKYIKKVTEDFLKALSISTTRGILYSELRGSQIHNAILPIIMMNTLLPAEGSILP